MYKKTTILNYFLSSKREISGEVGRSFWFDLEPLPIEGSIYYICRLASFLCISLVRGLFSTVLFYFLLQDISSEVHLYLSICSYKFPGVNFLL